MEEVFLGLGEAATAVQWTPPTLPENLPLANEHKGVDNESAGDEKPWQNHLTGIASMCRQHASNTLGLEYWDAGDKAVLAAQPARTLRNMALAGDECRSWNGGGANDGWLPPLLTHASLHSDATTTLATVAAAGGGHGTGNGIGPSFLGNRTRRASSSVQSGHTSLLNKARKHEKELFPALKLPAAASLKREQVDSAALLEAMEAVSTWLGTSGPGNAWMDSGGPVLGASSSKRSLPPLAHSRSDAEFSLFLSPLSPSPTPFKSISAQSMNPGGPAQSSTGEGGGNETEEKTQQGPARASVGGSSGGGKDSARREATPPSEGVVDPDFMATTLPGGIASPIPPQPLPRNGSGGHGFSSRSQHRPSLEGPARATTGEAKPQTEAEAEGGPAAPQCVQLTVYGTQLVNGPWQPRAPLSYSLASTSSRSGSHSGPMRRLGSNSAIPLSWHNGDALSPSLGSMTFEESKRQMLGLKSKASQDATLPVSNFLPFRAAAPLLRSTELWAMGAEAVMGLWVKEVIRTHWASIGLPPSKQARKKARKKGMKRAYHSPYALQAFPEPLHHDPPQHTRFAGNALFTATTAFPMLKRGSLMEEKHGADEDPGHSHGLQPGTASLDTALSSWAASRMKAVQGTRQRFREYLVSMKAQPRVHVCALLHWLYDDIDSKDFEAKGRRLKALAAAAEHATASHCAPSHSLLKLLTLTAVPLLQRGGALSDRSLLALVWPLVQGIVEAVLRILELPASSRLVTVPGLFQASVDLWYLLAWLITGAPVMSSTELPPTAASAIRQSKAMSGGASDTLPTDTPPYTPLLPRPHLVPYIAGHPAFMLASFVLDATLGSHLDAIMTPRPRRCSPVCGSPVSVMPFSALPKFGGWAAVESEGAQEGRGRGEYWFLKGFEVEEGGDMLGDAKGWHGALASGKTAPQAKMFEKLELRCCRMAFCNMLAVAVFP